MPSSPRSQRGLALLMAMLIVVIATTVAVNIVHEEKFTIRKNAHIQTQQRAAQYAAGLEDFARVLLREDSEENKTDGPGDLWDGGIQGQAIPGGYIGGTISDEQSLFNLNSVLDSQVALTRLERLCDNLEVDDQFIPALLDWLDNDSDIRYPDGMEENYEDYRVANREMSDISELLLVHNVTPEIYEKLQPHLTALPVASTLNLNTASAVVLQALDPDLDVSEVIKEREDNPFDSVDDFVERLKTPMDTEGLSVDTRYFRALGQVVQGEQTYNLAVLIYRDTDGVTRVINRTLGVF